MLDRLFFLKDGKIVESSSHDELIELGDEYVYLLNLQAFKDNKEKRMHK